MTDQSGAVTADAPTNTPHRGGGGMLGPLRYRDYRLLFLGQLISALGDSFYAVAMPWYMLTQGGGPANLGLALTAYGVPMGAMSLLGGWLSDKLRARRVMLISDFARIFVVGALAWATFGTHAPLLEIAALTATLGVFDGLFMPASMAVAPDLLPDDQLQAANGMYFGLMRLATMVGPALGGLVVSQVSSSAAFVVDAATFAISTATLLFIRNRVIFTQMSDAQVPTASVEGADATDVAAAHHNSLWRFALSAPYVLVVLLVAIIGNMLNGAVFQVAIPSLAQGPLHAGALGYGLIDGAFGGGMLLGSLLAGALGNRISRGIYALHFYAFQAVTIAALALAVSLWMAIGLMVLTGLFNGVANVTFLTLLQRRLPRNFLGRVMGALMFANFATLPLSAALGGFATAKFGPAPIIVVGACILLVAIMIGYLSRDLREM